MYEFALMLLRLSTLFGIFPFKFQTDKSVDEYKVFRKKKGFPFKCQKLRLIFGLPFFLSCVWYAYMGSIWIPFMTPAMYYTKYRTLVYSLSATITTLCLGLSFFGTKQLEFCLNESYMLLLESNLKYQNFWYNPITFLILIAATHTFKILYFMVLLPHVYLVVLTSHLSNFPSNFIQYIVLFMATTAEISFQNINDRLNRMKKYKILVESIVTQMELHWRVVDFVEKFNNALGARLLALLVKTLMFKFFVLFTILLSNIPNNVFKKADLPFYAFIDWLESTIISFGIIIYTSYCSNRLFAKSKHTLVHLRELSYNNTLTDKVDTVISIFSSQIQRRNCYISAGNVIDYKMSLVLTITSSTLIYAVTWCQFITAS